MKRAVKKGNFADIVAILNKVTLENFTPVFVENVGADFGVRVQENIAEFFLRLIEDALFKNMLVSHEQTSL